MNQELEKLKKRNAEVYDQFTDGDFDRHLTDQHEWGEVSGARC